MNMLNQIILEGHCVNDAEFSDVPIPRAKVVIAVDRKYRNAEGGFVSEVSNFDIESFGKVAETASKYGKKGNGIRVVGRLKQHVWTDETGKKHSRVSVVAEHISTFGKQEVQ